MRALLIFLLLRPSGRFDIDQLLADAIVPVLRQYPGGKLLRYIHQGEFILDVDFADGVPGNVSMEGDRAYHVVGTNAMDATQA